MIKCLIFDLDDTLCDYQRAKKNAQIVISKILSTIKVDLNKFWEAYQIIEPDLFSKFLAQTISREEYRFHRFSDVLSLFLQDSDEKKLLVMTFNRLYMQETNQKITLFDDVIPFFTKVQTTKLKMAILTNGPLDGQMEKYKVTALDKYIDHIFVGEAIGCVKPSSDAFFYVLKTLGCAPQQAIMIGDSLKDDYLGAKALDMNAILLNRSQSQYNAVPQLSSLLELPNFLSTYR